LRHPRDCFWDLHDGKKMGRHEVNPWRKKQEEEKLKALEGKK